METDNFFHLCVTGQIVCLEFPILFHNRPMFCRYDVIAGADWELLSGLKTGITQNAIASDIDSNKIVFNMPIEFTFKSTNPHGWPQLVFSLYGKNFWGTETSQGYGRVYVPLSGNMIMKHVPILTPKCSNMWSALVSWITDKNPEFRDPKILVDGTKTKTIRTESYGHLILNLQTVSRGINKMSLKCGVKKCV